MIRVAELKWPNQAYGLSSETNLLWQGEFSNPFATQPAIFHTSVEVGIFSITKCTCYTTDVMDDLYYQQAICWISTPFQRM